MMMVQIISLIVTTNIGIILGKIRALVFIKSTVGRQFNRRNFVYLIIRFLKYILFLLFFAFSFWFCNKKMFGRVTVKGKVLHFFTKKPVVSRITLRTNATFRGASFWLTEAIADQNGDFTMWSKPSKMENYHLFVDNLPWDILNNNSRVELKENETLDIGTVYTGEQTIFCRIHLQSVSGYSIELNSPKFHAFAAGTNTTFIDSRKFTYPEFKSSNASYRINYEVVGLQSFNTTFAPITTSDTVDINISY